MRYVEFYETTKKGQRTIGRVELHDSTMKFVNMPKNLEEELRTQSIRIAGGKEVSMADGIAFLRALPWKYTGSYLRASAVRTAPGA